MTIKILTFVAGLGLFMTAPAQAACERALRGIQVDSQFRMGNSWDYTYFNITDHALGAKSVIQVKYANCEDDECKQKLDLLENANWKHQLLKFSVDEHTCSHLWDYFIQNNGGGTADFLNINQLTTVEVDTTYPF
jgi:hypothetical protein